MKKNLIFIAMAVSFLVLGSFWIYLQTGVKEGDVEYLDTHTPREIQAEPKESKLNDDPDRVAVAPDSTVGEEAKPIDDAPEFEPMDAPGWWVWGNVTSSAGEPLADAEVGIFLFNNISQEGEAIHRVQANEKGRYISWIPAPEWMSPLPRDAELHLVIEACAAHPGYRFLEHHNNTLRSIPFPDRKGPALRLDLQLKPGANLYGRVERPDGEPAKWTNVFLGNEEGYYERGKSGYMGYYFFQIKKPGLYYLLAEKFGVGVSKPTSLFLDAGCSLEGPTLVLQECGVLAGTVVDPEGAPVDDVILFAFSENLLESPDRELSNANMDDSVNYYTPAGEYELFDEGVAITDRNGRFRIGGLQHGRYFLWSPDIYWRIEWYDSEIPAHVLEDFPRILYGTGSEDIRFTFPHHRLYIHVIDEQGSPVPDAYVFFRGEDPLPGPRDSTSALGVCQVLALPGAFTVFAQKGELLGTAKVEVKEEDCKTEVEVILEKRPPPGRVRLSFIGPDNKTIEQFQRLRVDCWGEDTVYSSLLFLSDMERNEASEFIFSLPPERYRLCITPGGPDNIYLDAWIDNVIVESGKDCPVEISLQAGGRVRITAYFEEARALEVKWYYIEAIEAPVLDTWKGFGSRIKHGVPHLHSDPFLGGLYELEVTGEGFTQEKIRFQIFPGRVTDVSITLKAK